MNRLLFQKHLVGAAILLIGAFLLGACGVRGSGNVQTEERQARDFSAISLNGFGKLIIEQSGAESLSITADDNILPLITSEVRNGTLHLGFKDERPINNVNDITFRVTVSNLEAIELSGAGSVEATNIDTDQLSVTSSGAGNVNISGTTEKQEIELSGVGSYNGEDLVSKEATVEISGAGNATVQVSDALDAQISGAGSVTYIGDPQVKQDISGAGAVNKR
jgi:hypothetical protein